jgi:DNA-binding transcriptional MerR regulator
MGEILSSETENLELHVNLCEHRYQILTERITKVEHKVDELNKTINQFKNEAFKTLIGVAGTIIIAMIGFIAIILNVVPQ